MCHYTPAVPGESTAPLWASAQSAALAAALGGAEVLRAQVVTATGAAGTGSRRSSTRRQLLKFDEEFKGRWDEEGTEGQQRQKLRRQQQQQREQRQQQQGLPSRELLQSSSGGGGKGRTPPSSAPAIGGSREVKWTVSVALVGCCRLTPVTPD